MPFRNVCLLLGLLCLAPVAGAAQNKPAASPINNAFIQKQFGATCTLLLGPLPAVADFDGDGVEDVVIPAKCTNPLMDQAENSFKVVDPYNGYFGYGDPKITTEFASEDPDFRGRSLLIIHGAGPQAWRSETPKAKFVVINLPYRQLSVKKMTMKKNKAVMGIFVDEAGADQTTSTLFWDGRKYKYQPLGSNLE